MPPKARALLAAALALGAAAVARPPPASAALSLSGTPKVTFLAHATGGLVIHGHGSELSVADDGRRVLVIVPLAHLDTGVSLRNRHMREKFLQTDKFPTAELDVARGAISFPAEDGRSVAGDLPGLFSVHGVSRRIIVHYVARRSGGLYSIDGTLKVDLRDYAIKQPSFLGVSVAPLIEVAVAFRVADR